MTCTSPPALDDIQLLRYLDGEADPRAMAHIERCPHCRREAERLRHFHNQLTARFYRIVCPDSLELADFYLGTLQTEPSAAIAQHLADCPHCSQELAQLRDYLDALTSSVAMERLKVVRDQVRVLIAQLVDVGLGTSGPAPAFAGLRGEDEGPLIYQAGDVEVVVEVQDDAEYPGRKVILGLITGLDDVEGVEAHLWQADERVATVAADLLGNFEFYNLAPATFELIISGGELEIHIQSLQVGTEHS